MQPLRPGDPPQIGGYRLIGRLTPGGMGEVFVGETVSRRKVVVKVLRPDLAGDLEFLARFANEVAAGRRVSGFYTAPVVDYDLAANPPWFATAFVNGPTLSAKVAEHGPLPPPAVRELGIALAEGLAAIHKENLVHRDLKPGNIILADDGPRIIDFGIARNLDATPITENGKIFGTPTFMSPEQATGQRVGPKSDIFSLGAVLAYAATGRGPFDGPPVAAVIWRITNQAPDLGGVPSELRDTIADCLSKERASRPSLDNLITRLSPAPAPVPSASFSPSGSAPSSAGPLPCEGLLLQGNGLPLWRPSFSADGRALATIARSRSSDEYSVTYIWDTATATLTGDPIHAHGALPEDLTWSPDCRMLVVPDFYRGLHMWDVAARQPASMPGIRHLDKDRWQRFTFSPDGSLLAATSRDRVRLLNAATMTPVARDLHVGPGHAAQPPIFSANSQFVLATKASAPVDVYLCDCTARSPAFKRIRDCKGLLGAATFSADGTLLAMAVGYDAVVNHSFTIVQTASHELARFSVDGLIAAGVTFAPAGRLLAVTTRSVTGRLDKGRVTLLDFAGMSARLPQAPEGTCRLEGVDVPVSQLLFSPDGRLLVSATEDMPDDPGRQTIRFSATADGKSLATARVRSPVKLLFSPDGRLCVASSGAHEVRAWDTQSMHRDPIMLAGHVPAWDSLNRDVAFSPDGCLLAATDHRGLVLWNRAALTQT